MRLVQKDSGRIRGRLETDPFFLPQTRIRGQQHGDYLVWFGLVWFGLVWFGLVFRNHYSNGSLLVVSFLCRTLPIVNRSGSQVSPAPQPTPAGEAFIRLRLFLTVDMKMRLAVWIFIS